MRRVWREVGNATHPERQLSPAGPGYYDLVWTFSDIFHMDDRTFPRDPVLVTESDDNLHTQQLLWTAPDTAHSSLSNWEIAIRTTGAFLSCFRLLRTPFLTFSLGVRFAASTSGTRQSSTSPLSSTPTRPKICSPMSASSLASQRWRCTSLATLLTRPTAGTSTPLLGGRTRRSTRRDLGMMEGASFRSWPHLKRSSLTFFVGLRFSFYPIRTTITNALKQSAKSGTDIKWHPHPGYSISRPEDVKAPEFYPKKSPLHETHRELRADFAAGMRNTKICVVRHSSCFPPFRKSARWELTQTGSPRSTVRLESREEDDPKVGAGAVERMRGCGRHSYRSGGRAEGVHDRAQAGLAN